MEQEQSYRKQEVSYKLLKEEADSLEKLFYIIEDYGKKYNSISKENNVILERLLLVHKFSNLEEIQQKIRALEDSLLVLKVEEKEKKPRNLTKNLHFREQNPKFREGKNLFHRKKKGK
ncbi:hypothetical protein HMPREF9466_01783 [Fusobacterium necrophorum subsp. funduliforme 1_1_36S]|nr:hypothetical protein HMPREF9466_01783 [Fusobacterium necrophorum subsp. funduliforme 1_1_36S]